MNILEDIRVLDFGRYIAGPYCAALLGDLGAEVIRIERLSGSEDRFVHPLKDDGGEGETEHPLLGVVRGFSRAHVHGCSRVGRTLQDKVLKELDAKIDAETLKLRELRYKMVDAGVYKSWCAPPPPRDCSAHPSLRLPHGAGRGCDLRAGRRLTWRSLDRGSHATRTMAAAIASQVPSCAQRVIRVACPLECCGSRHM